jgi:alkylation response protein AidB-like acyl-CoA dehydrogenase
VLTATAPSSWWWSRAVAAETDGISLPWWTPTLRHHAQALDPDDSRNAARIEFLDVDVNADALLGAEGDAWPALEQVLDRGRAAIAAEMLGGVQETFERTVDYLKQREQFGTKIGSFQALQHRAAHMFSEIELLKSVVLDACANVDANPRCCPAASLAKARPTILEVNEAVQMHGGIGTTDELDIGLFLKRARVCMQILGDRFHRDRAIRHAAGVLIRAIVWVRIYWTVLPKAALCQHEADHRCLPKGTLSASAQPQEQHLL